MTDRSRLLFFLAALCAVAAGCRTTLTGSYWQPAFTSQQQTSGGTQLDLVGGLNVAPDKYALVYELVGDTRRNRVRVDYWKIHGTGSAVSNDFDFGGTNFPATITVATTVDLESVGILWEPALVRTGNFRLRLIAGLDLLKFGMKVEDANDPLVSAEFVVPGPGSPLSSLGIDYIPVPMFGVGVEVAFNKWVKLILRGQMFDTQYLSMIQGFRGTFVNWTAGLLIGQNRGVSAFVGLRSFHAEYAYTGSSGTDTADSTLQGLTAGVTLCF